MHARRSRTWHSAHVASPGHFRSGCRAVENLGCRVGSSWALCGQVFTCICSGRVAWKLKIMRQVHITGKYGVRYGASLRKQIKKIEITQHAKYTCSCEFWARRVSAYPITDPHAANLGACTARCAYYLSMHPFHKTTCIRNMTAYILTLHLSISQNHVPTGNTYGSPSSPCHKSSHWAFALTHAYIFRSHLLLTVLSSAPVCGKDAVKRQATGIWKCSGCRKVRDTEGIHVGNRTSIFCVGGCVVDFTSNKPDALPCAFS